MWGFSSCSTWPRQSCFPGFRAEAQQSGLMGLVALQHVRPWVREPSVLHWQADSLPLSHQGSPHYPFNACKSWSNVPFLMPDIGSFFFSWFCVSLGKDLSIFINVIKKILFYFIEFLHDLSIFTYFCSQFYPAYIWFNLFFLSKFKTILLLKQFTYHITEQLKMCYLMTFSIANELCIHYHSQFGNTFINLKRNLMPTLPNSPTPRQPLIFIFQVCLVWTFIHIESHYNMQPLVVNFFH